MSDGFITDFSEFITEMKDANSYEITFKIGDKEYKMKYSELTSDQDIRSSKEFEKWFADKYKSTEKDYGLSAALDGQWRVWKMLQPHTKGMATFEDFLKLPTTVSTAIMRAVERDLTKRYPHLAG